MRKIVHVLIHQASYGELAMDGNIKCTKVHQINDKIGMSYM